MVLLTHRGEKKKSYYTFAGSQMVFSTHIKEEKKLLHTCGHVVVFLTHTWKEKNDIAHFGGLEVVFSHLWACEWFFSTHIGDKLT
jgi:hypothetical protein